MARRRGWVQGGARGPCWKSSSPPTSHFVPLVNTVLCTCLSYLFGAGLGLTTEGVRNGYREEEANWILAVPQPCPRNLEKQANLQGWVLMGALCCWWPRGGAAATLVPHLQLWLEIQEPQLLQLPGPEASLPSSAASLGHLGPGLPASGLVRPSPASPCPWVARDSALDPQKDTGHRLAPFLSDLVSLVGQASSNCGAVPSYGFGERDPCELFWEGTGAQDTRCEWRIRFCSHSAWALPGHKASANPRLGRSPPTLQCFPKTLLRESGGLRTRPG